MSNVGKSAISGAIAIGAVAIILSSLAIAGVSFGASSATEPPTQRVIYMMAIEPKGSTHVDKEPFPTQPLPAGGGYKLVPPDDSGKWTVETYRWMPNLITVNQGDEVTLEILGVNGKKHEAFVEHYVDSFTIERGKLTTLTFTADTPGTFKIVCTTHPPAMTGYLIVQPTI